MEIDVTNAVNKFRDILEYCCPLITELSKEDRTGSFVDDWMQANWERIVESSIDPRMRVVLEVYGNGADCNIESSRVWMPDASPTTPVYIRYVGNDILENAIDGKPAPSTMTIDHFASLKGGWPSIESPFDHVVISEDQSTAIPIRDLRYYIIV